MFERSRLQICFLGAENSLDLMQDRLASYGSVFRPIDSYSWESHDEQLADLFLENWRGEISEEEMQKINEHGAIVHAASVEPGLSALEDALEALQVISYMLENGAVAAMILGSNMVYSPDAWKQIACEASELEAQGSRRQLFHLCSFACVRRGIESDYCYETIGYHFLGLPEIYIPMESADALEILSKTEQLAEEIWERGIETAQETHLAEWTEDIIHTEDDCGYNHFGILIFPE